MRFVAQQAFQRQTVRREFLGGEELFHRRFGNRHDFRADVTGGLAGAAGGVLITADHPLIGAVGLVFSCFKKCIGAEAFPVAIEGDVELQAMGQFFRAFAQVAGELFIAFDFAFPLFEGGFPGRIGFAETGEIPAVGRFNFAARRELFDFRHA